MQASTWGLDVAFETTSPAGSPSCTLHCPSTCKQNLTPVSRLAVVPDKADMSAPQPLGYFRVESFHKE